VDRLLSAMAIFIEYPLLAAVIGVLLLGLGRWTRHRTAVGVGVVWLLYAAYETGMQQRWLCSGECNIRIDLLVIYPVLLIGLVVAGASLLRAPREPRPPQWTRGGWKRHDSGGCDDR
jgi:formate hydrogenlyase subunit 3/multisubunit Na+/H+ antiporter MnhD subunit